MAVAFAHGVKQQVAIICYEGATPTAPAAPTIEVSVDGGAFAAADNAAAYDAGTAPDGYLIQGACVFVTLSATEMTSAVVVVRVTDGNLTEAQYGGPYYPGGHYTAARGDALDNLDAAVSTRGTADPGDAMTLTPAYDAAKTAAQAGEAAAALEAYDPLTAADVETAPTNFSSLGITAEGRVDVGAVGGTTVTDPDDLKADVSALALEATVGALNNLSSAQAQAAATAALNAYDPPTKAELDAAEGNIRGTDGDTLKTLSDEIAEGGGGGGDATAENQQAILAHLVAIKGPDWAGDDDTLAALAAGLAALPAEALAAIEAAHGEGPYDQAAMLAAKLVTSQFVAEGDELLFFRDSSPQAVSLVVSPPVDLSGWDLWLTIKPATPEVREEQDNASALCSVSGSGYSTGLMTFSVSAANVAGMSLDRAYDYSIEGKLGEQYRLFRRGTAKLTYNVRRNV